MPHTVNCPKCLIDFDGKQFLHHQIKMLHEVGIKDIIIVTGYFGAKIRRECEQYKGIKFFHNFDFAKTGTLNSMSLATEEFDNELLVLNSDIIFTTDCLRNVIATSGNVVTMEPERCEEGATAIQIDHRGKVTDMGFLDDNDADGLSVGIVKFTKKSMSKVIPFLRNYPRDIHCFVFTLIKHLLNEGETVKYVNCDYGTWCEIDTLEDLKLYKDVIIDLLNRK